MAEVMEQVTPKPEFNGSFIQHEEFLMSNLAIPAFGLQSNTQEPEHYGNSNASCDVQSINTILEQEQSPVEDTYFSASAICPAPLCRQFWKAGNYYSAFSSETRVSKSKNHLHVHPKFLHSNATSHKWAFGAVAELIDNVVDEIPLGATYVAVDKISNPRDDSPALLIQDDGNGMSPETIRHCMSFGFSEKTSESAIDGNGFKTGSMRLGADVIVFSRRMHNSTFTQSIGLLSYSYLSCSGLDRIVVPMIDYEYVMSTGTLETVNHGGKENFQSNVSTILQWSPYSTEAELLQQFEDIGWHGTKVIIYNLWFTNDGTVELNFDRDPEDIRLRGPDDLVESNSKRLTSEENVASQYHYSLRLYLSILYLGLPQNFNIILRGKVVERRSIARDLKFPEFVVYRPHRGAKESNKLLSCISILLSACGKKFPDCPILHRFGGFPSVCPILHRFGGFPFVSCDTTHNKIGREVIITVGFLKEALDVNIHGFNVYHKNRLILPFWQVTRCTNSRGRGVVGVIEANFVEPIHNKQDFERTSLFQKLEARLKQMTWEYWDHHCGLIGYLPPKKFEKSLSSKDSSFDGSECPEVEPSGLNNSSNLSPTDQSDPLTAYAVGNSQTNAQQCGTQSIHNELVSALQRRRRPIKPVPDATSTANLIDVQPVSNTANQQNEQEVEMLMQENDKLRSKCLEFEKKEEELNLKVLQLRRKIEVGRHEYSMMLTELLQLGVDTGENKSYSR